MNTNNPYIAKLLSDEQISALLDKQERAYWDAAIGLTSSRGADAAIATSRLTFLMAMSALENSEDKELLEEAYKLLKVYPIEDEDQRKALNELLNLDTDDETVVYYFLLSAIALQLDKTMSARLSLSKYEEEQDGESDWGKHVMTMMLRALLYLIRKDNGYADIRKAIAAIETLQTEQTQYESDYINQFSAYNQTREAIWLVALYHTSKAVVETAQYILKGYEYPNRRIDTVVRSHMDMARKMTSEPRKNSLLGVIEVVMQTLIKNAIWNGTAFNEKLRMICKAKGEAGLLELLPSQRRAMNSNLFDVAANSIVLQMPTSAGKTLLAEFNIAVTKSMLPESKIVYIVPSRALVNQVYQDLRLDLSVLHLSVEKTSSVNEVDPSEDIFLQADDIDVIVSTPEKMDLLIRRNHPSVQNVSLFIVDEAHMIRNGERGARLELLIAILRRERPQAKYMILSPFLPGDNAAIAEWLGGGNTIDIDWKPSEKIVMGIDVDAQKVKTDLIPSPYAASYASDYSIENDLDIELQSTSHKARILEYTCKRFAEAGKTQLILCKGRGTANTTAKKIYDSIEGPAVSSGDIPIISKYLEEEIGCSTLYSRLLKKGVAVHHAGLSDETKLLVEHLIRDKQIQYVCATTTIAEGVNFPVSTVYFDTYDKGGSRGERLSSNDFWNISGRAGRTMVDDFGKIILPFNSPQNKEKGLNLIRESAEELTSVLSQLFDDRHRIIQMLDGGESALWTLAHEYKNSYGPLFQYFIHLLHVSQNEYVEDVEDLFKDTLMYSKLSYGEQEEFIGLCRKIYQTIEAKYASNKGLLSYADKTGFSVPSVLQIMHEQAQNQSIADIERWKPEQLFNPQDVSNLTEKVRVIATLPETKLGTESSAAPFNPEILAKILIAWVNGDKINTISNIHPMYHAQRDVTERVSEFVRYMNDVRFRASWGLSALEGIVKGVEGNVVDSYVPSYVYYGVGDKKALAMRMIGVPRSLSASLSQIIDDDISNYTYKQLREHVNSLSLREWDTVIPRGSRLSGEEWKRIADILMKGK